MTCLFVLVDSRHDPQKIDIEFMDWLGENGVPFAIVFTKLDKMSSAAAKIVTGKYLDKLKETWEELLRCSIHRATTDAAEHNCSTISTS